MKGKTLLLFVVAFTCFSCRNSWHKTSEFVFSEADSLTLPETGKLTPEDISDISKNISASVEMSNLFQKLKIPFEQSNIAFSVDPNVMASNHYKAIKLGILGADLGYLSTYGETVSHPEILASIRKLSEDINVSRFFDFESIKRLAQDRSGHDSLLMISVDSYAQADKYLRENDQSPVSALMISGIWIETQYLATQAVSQFPDKMLINRIGEQKLIVNDLLLLLSPYCSQSSEFSRLCKMMQEIKDTYRGVKLTYNQEDPVFTEKNGKLVVTQSETSVIELSKEQLESIVKVSKNVRNRLISINQQ
jgi:hypothetical protein